MAFVDYRINRKKVSSLNHGHNPLIIAFLILLFVSYAAFFMTTKSQAIAEEQQIRSTSLEKRIIESDNEQRIEYVNGNGALTYAADKHYAVMSRIQSENTILEKYFDDKGEPAQQIGGYYAILKKYDKEGLIQQIIYLGYDGNPVMISTGYAISIRYTNKAGQVEKEYYYDMDGKPVNTVAYGFGCYKEYDEFGRNTVITYLNKYDEPIITGQGFAIANLSYYETGRYAGKVKEKYYFDANGDPIKLSNDQFGISMVYDEYGRVQLITFLDKNGIPITNSSGYSTVKKTYYEDDTVKSEFYYDLNGLPVALSEGQYGILFENGKTHYLDENGNILINIRLILYNNQIAVFVVCLVLLIISLVANKKINMLLLIIYIIAILYMTLMYRNNQGRGVFAHPFLSYKMFFTDPKATCDTINNIVLFFPLGAILYKLYPKKSILWIPVILSVLIESVQYFTGRGICEVDDVISNGLGGVIGFYAGRMTSIFLFCIKKYKH